MQNFIDEFVQIKKKCSSKCLGLKNCLRRIFRALITLSLVNFILSPINFTHRPVWLIGINFKFSDTKKKKKNVFLTNFLKIKTPTWLIRKARKPRPAWTIVENLLEVLRKWKSSLRSSVFGIVAGEFCKTRENRALIRKRARACTSLSNNARLFRDLRSSRNWKGGDLE